MGSVSFSQARENLLLAKFIGRFSNQFVLLRKGKVHAVSVPFGFLRLEERHKARMAGVVPAIWSG